jgi:hypothetical protein
MLSVNSEHKVVINYLFNTFFVTFVPTGGYALSLWFILLEALNTLLKYNKEDAVNLSHLRIALDKLP